MVLLAPSLAQGQEQKIDQGQEQNIDKEFTRNSAAETNSFWRWVEQVAGIQKSYALVIGISNYNRAFAD